MDNLLRLLFIPPSLHFISCQVLIPLLTVSSHSFSVSPDFPFFVILTVISMPEPMGLLAVSSAREAIGRDPVCLLSCSRLPVSTLHLQIPMILQILLLVIVFVLLLSLGPLFTSLFSHCTSVI